MTTDTQCRAITLKGVRCSKKAATAGFCSQHFPSPKKSTLLEKAKTAGEVVTTATGVIELIKTAFELWQALPFGSGPDMPDAYDYLANEFGPSWGASLVTTARRVSTGRKLLTYTISPNMN